MFFGFGNQNKKICIDVRHRYYLLDKQWDFPDEIRILILKTEVDFRNQQKFGFRNQIAIYEIAKQCLTLLFDY